MHFAWTNPYRQNSIWQSQALIVFFIIILYPIRIPYYKCVREEHGSENCGSCLLGKMLKTDICIANFTLSKLSFAISKVLNIQWLQILLSGWNTKQYLLYSQHLKGCWRIIMIICDFCLMHWLNIEFKAVTLLCQFDFTFLILSSGVWLTWAGVRGASKLSVLGEEGMLLFSHSSLVVHSMDV